VRPRGAGRYTEYMGRIATYLGATVRLALIVALTLAVVLIPLLTIYRSTCEEKSTRYSLVAPWDDPPADCRDHRSGLDLLRKEVGLE
jgi:hypothetical protein